MFPRAVPCAMIAVAGLMASLAAGEPHRDALAPADSAWTAVVAAAPSLRQGTPVLAVAGRMHSRRTPAPIPDQRMIAVMVDLLLGSVGLFAVFQLARRFGRGTVPPERGMAETDTCDAPMRPLKEPALADPAVPKPTFEAVRARYREHTGEIERLMKRL